jgi:hypothetical protein
MEKLIKYGKIPDNFDETKQYIEQLKPVDMGDYLFIDVIVKELDLSNDNMETPEQNTDSQPYAPEPTMEERLEALESAMLEMILGGAV